MHIKRSALVHYSAQQMYDLVADIERYGEFLPWCGGARILARDGEKLEASIVIAASGLNRAFTTANRMQSGRRIEMNLKEGPFRKLHGDWHFTPLSETACKIELDLAFEFEHSIVGRILGPVFIPIANGLVDAFHLRAKQLYGENGG
jgi:ribosome-associated toxin RatA of RatAB toxin-antitoxin module